MKYDSVFTLPSSPGCRCTEIGTDKTFILISRQDIAQDAQSTTYVLFPYGETDQILTIVKAKVVTNSSEDSKGRVKIEAAGIWENSKEVGDLYPVCNAIPLNEGDVVYVYLFDGDYSNPLVLGKARDNNFDPSISVPSSFSVLWDSVSKDGSYWSIAYTEGEELYIENSKGMVMAVSGGDIMFHDGANGGMVNIQYLNTMVQAILKDLAVLGSGSNLSSWLATDAMKLEDTTILH